MKGDKADGTTELGVEERWVGIGEGELAKFVAVLYYQFIEMHLANYTTNRKQTG